MAKFITGNEFGKHVADKLGLKNTKRIIIDIPLDDCVTIYAQIVGDENVFGIEWDNRDFKIVKVPLWFRMFDNLKNWSNRMKTERRAKKIKEKHERCPACRGLKELANDQGHIVVCRFCKGKGATK